MEGPRPEGTETLMATPSFTPKADLGSLRIHDGERKSRGMGRRITIVAIPVVIFAGIVAAAFAFRSQKPMVEVVSAARPDAGGPQTLLNASGYITPRRRATIAAKITGRVTGVFFDEGTRVAQEQLLATLDDLDVKRALDAAKADREAAQAAIADYEVQLRNANIQLKRAQDYCTIRAPFAGIVVSKDAQVGEMVSPNSAGGGFTRTGIATIVDMKSNEIEVDVNESYIARVEPGQKVTATLDAYPDKPFPAKVRTVIPTADRQKATVKVRIAIPDLDKYNFILPDMGVKVAFLEEPKLPAKDKNKDKDKTPQAVAYIPKSAVRSDSGVSVVFLVHDGKIERRAVSLGTDRGTDVAVLSGISPGDSLVVKGPENLHDGDKVEIR